MTNSSESPMTVRVAPVENLVSWARRSFSFFVPCRVRDPAHDRLERDLDRLIRTSPHLLADIGFVRDAARSNPVRAIWKSGDVELELHPMDRAAANPADVSIASASGTPAEMSCAQR